MIPLVPSTTRGWELCVWYRPGEGCCLLAVWSLSHCLQGPFCSATWSSGLSLQHPASPLSASAIFISLLATSHHLPASLSLPHSAPDRLTYSKCLQPATSSPASLQSQCSLPHGGVCTYLMPGSLQQHRPHLATADDYLGLSQASLTLSAWAFCVVAAV